MSEFVSNMAWEKWEEIVELLKIHYYSEKTLIVEAKNNRIRMDLLGCTVLESAIKNLFYSAPSSELCIWRGEWFSSSNQRGIADYDTVILGPDWNPPEKPKVLTGWDYIASLPAGTVVRYKDFTIFRYTCKDGEQASFLTSHGIYSYWNKIPSHFPQLNDISASNSTII